MTRFLKYVLTTSLLFLLWSCSASEEEKKKIVIPDKITYLFVTQPSCPSCDRLEETMGLKRPKTFLNNYFDVQKVYLGEKLPQNIPLPNGTPTVYFLGANNEVLVEQMIGEKDEIGLMEYLEDAVLEFKNTYKVDLIKLKELENDKNISTTNL